MSTDQNNMAALPPELEQALVSGYQGMADVLLYDHAMLITQRAGVAAELLTELRNTEKGAGLTDLAESLSNALIDMDENYQTIVSVLDLYQIWDMASEDEMGNIDRINELYEDLQEKIFDEECRVFDYDNGDSQFSV